MRSDFDDMLDREAEGRTPSETDALASFTATRYSSPQTLAVDGYGPTVDFVITHDDEGRIDTWLLHAIVLPGDIEPTAPDALSITYSASDMHRQLIRTRRDALALAARVGADPAGTDIDEIRAIS